MSREKKLRRYTFKELQGKSELRLGIRTNSEFVLAEDVAPVIAELRRYVLHVRGCGYTGAGIGGTHPDEPAELSQECTCGLDQLLAETEDIVNE